jgi:predicted RNase H-like HicB family nuclease
MTTTVRKSLWYYLSLKYPVTIKEATDGGFVAEIEDLPGCLAQGDTIAEAYENIESARRLWLESAYEDNLDIPLPADHAVFSGKFNVRVPASLHRRLRRLADREGVSLNQYVVYALSHATGVSEGKASNRP